MTAPQTPAHTPVQCVTVEGLLESYAALTKLLAGTRDRIRDELVREAGVGIGDRFEVLCDDGKRLRIWVTQVSVDITFGVVALYIHGRATRMSGAEHIYFWNPTTCRVVRKGGGA